MVRRFAVICVLALVTLLGPGVGSSGAQWLPVNPVKTVEQQADGALLVLDGGFLRFQVCSDSIVRVTYSLERNLTERPDFLVVEKTWPKAAFTLKMDDPKLDRKSVV